MDERAHGTTDEEMQKANVTQQPGGNISDNGTDDVTLEIQILHHTATWAETNRFDSISLMVSILFSMREPNTSNWIVIM